MISNFSGALPSSISFILCSAGVAFSHRVLKNIAAAGQTPLPCLSPYGETI
jgi:hypothetical protein